MQLRRERAQERGPELFFFFSPRTGMICFKYYGRIFILGEETRWARNWRETADVGRFERVEKVSKKEPKQYRGGLTPRWAPAGTAVEGGGAGRAFRRWGGAGAAGCSGPAGGVCGPRKGDWFSDLPLQGAASDREESEADRKSVV